MKKTAAKAKPAPKPSKIPLIIFNCVLDTNGNPVMNWQIPTDGKTIELSWLYRAIDGNRVIIPAGVTMCTGWFPPSTGLFVDMFGGKRPPSGTSVQYFIHASYEELTGDYYVDNIFSEKISVTIP